MLSLKMGSVPRYYEGKDLNQAYRRKENIGFFLAVHTPLSLLPPANSELKERKRRVGAPSFFWLKRHTLSRNATVLFCTGL